MYDLLVKGGRIYDGSAMPSYYGDVGITAAKLSRSAVCTATQNAR